MHLNKLNKCKRREQNTSTPKVTTSLHLTTVTWSRDSHGLFDYEDSTAERKCFITRFVKYLVRVPTTPSVIELMSEKEMVAREVPREAVLLKVIPNKDSAGTFLIENCSRTGVYEEGTDKLWLITRSLKLNGEKQVRDEVDSRSTDCEGGRY